jgi:serine/threonine protein phosphatase PrpC
VRFTVRELFLLLAAFLKLRHIKMRRAMSGTSLFKNLLSIYLACDTLLPSINQKIKQQWVSSMRNFQPPKQFNQLGYAAPALLWQDDPFQIPRWLWLVLASSPLVALIVLFSVGIAVLLLILWLRGKRQPTMPPPIDMPPPVTQTAPPPATPNPDFAKTQASKKISPPSPSNTLVLTPVDEPDTLPVSGQRPAGIGWQIAGLTDVGLKRQLNEDNLLMAESTRTNQTPLGLYVVADGLGGHQGGEVASELTIEAIHRHFTEHLPEAESSFKDWLTEAANAANRAVLARQDDPDTIKKMGSTLVMALVTGEKAYLANVGDSRGYRLTAKTIEQVTVDHSLVERLVQIGQLTRDEARTHKNRNVVYNTIGDKPNLEVSLYQTPLEPGDRLLLCSDGLSGMVTDEHLLKISQNQPDPANACQLMVKAAKTAGGTDNITVIIVQM